MYLTRDEAIEKVGKDAVDHIDVVDCVGTGRILDNPDIIEFSTSIDLTNSKYDTLTAFYYQNWIDVDECDDFGNLDWNVYGYELD